MGIIRWNTDTAADWAAAVGEGMDPYARFVEENNAGEGEAVDPALVLAGMRRAMLVGDVERLRLVLANGQGWWETEKHWVKRQEKTERRLRRAGRRLAKSDRKMGMR